jgi:hypothetical protein
VPGKEREHPTLAPLIGSKLNLKLVRTHWGEFCVLPPLSILNWMRSTLRTGTDYLQIRFQLPIFNRTLKAKGRKFSRGSLERPPSIEEE